MVRGDCHAVEVVMEVIGVVEVVEEEVGAGNIGGDGDGAKRIKEDVSYAIVVLKFLVEEIWGCCIGCVTLCD